MGKTSPPHSFRKLVLEFLANLMRKLRGGGGVGGGRVRYLDRHI